MDGLVIASELQNYWTTTDTLLLFFPSIVLARLNTTLDLLQHILGLGLADGPAARQDWAAYSHTAGHGRITHS